MSDPNERYLIQNGNSRTAKIPQSHTGFILLLSLDKIFCPIFLPTFYRRESQLGKKQANIDGNLPFIFIKA
jgi:hypothetical protein